MIPDWTQLPQELLHIIAMNLENCFDVVHARSVCCSWRSSFPSLLRQSYTLPSFPIKNKAMCSLEKIPLFLFRVRPPIVVVTSDSEYSEYLLGGICRDESEDRMKILPSSSPLQCSVKIQFKGYEQTLMNMFSWHIVSMGHRYQISCLDPQGMRITYRVVAFLQLNNEVGSGFIVICNFLNTLLVLTSIEMKWKQVENIPGCPCLNLVSFRGRFYASFERDIFVIDPYSLEATPLRPSEHRDFSNCLVPCGSDEFFLVRETVNHVGPVGKLAIKVSRLDAEAGRWVEVSDLGDRVLFVECLINVACLAKELPYGCGVSGNSILFTTRTGVTLFYRYIRGCWRPLRENRVEILRTKSPVWLSWLSVMT
ncbi:hypothetical protein EUTSA_v10019678mg [Eutrema salsugineum]|uniref:KIB1-4 beta-propeller domain-containing protein n=1 Tax=Eutrema salsugineum TaxID=72664 RepID=V4KFV5_EUTSA|nr:F-box/kelch-repeat protein At1g64840 [Eutrema salsugineum]ESQ28712.1 hypothetical protein EUTSA_v10019678mg [Eutrema salsugineum]